MPSPFPGMDPYLEDPAICGDFHQNLAIEIQRQLAPIIGPRYLAALETKVTYDEIVIESPPEARERLARPDVGVWDSGDGPTGGVLLAIAPAPFVVVLTAEVLVKLFSVEIRSVDYGTLVTTIKILSPVNKRPKHPAAIAYQRKRRHLLRRDINLLEIDLLREGQRTPPSTEKLPEAPYFAFLTRGATPYMEVWPFFIQEPFPVIPVPLRDPDPDAPLNLGKALATIYDAALYGYRLRYTKAPPPPELLAKDRVWFDQHLRAAGVRE